MKTSSVPSSASALNYLRLICCRIPCGNSSFATIATEIAQRCHESAGLVVQASRVFHPKSEVGYGQSG